MASVKVLTVGSAAGSISGLFSKIKAIDAKHGKFDFALCVGDFFGPLLPSEDDEKRKSETNELLDGNIEAPLTCYIMQGENPLPDEVIQKFAKTGGELCKNVFLLNKSGLMTTVQGLRIACLGGIYDQQIFHASEAAPGFASPFFSTHTIDRLLASTMSNSSVGQNYKSLAAIQSSSSSSQLVDVLISNVLPSRITNFSSAPLPSPSFAESGVPPLDDVIRRLKPRYHFAANGGDPPAFWEREPYVWTDEAGRVGRFVSLGPFGKAPASGKKQRWFYAFSIAPNTPSSTPPPKPANATKNPFTEDVPRAAKRPFDGASGGNYIFGDDVRQPGKRPRVDNGDPGKPPPGYKCKRCESSEHFINDCPARDKPPEGYVCKICSNPGHFVRDCPTRHAVGDTGGKKPKEGYVCRACGSEKHYLDDCPVANQQPHRGGGKRGPPREIQPDECWFCLSNPNLAKHLIVAIGNECYVTLPKGQIVPTQSAVTGKEFKGVPGGGHVLIVPIAHYPTYTAIPADMADPIYEETLKFKTALRAMYAKHHCATVFFEIGKPTIGHAHVHAVPVPLKAQDKVEETFIEAGKMDGVEFEQDPDAALAGASAYFRVDLPDGRKIVHVMRGPGFRIQFGRQVLLTLLGLSEKRLDWKACLLSEEEDKADAVAFKAAFAPFDPSQ